LLPRYIPSFSQPLMHNGRFNALMQFPFATMHAAQVPSCSEEIPNRFSHCSKFYSEKWTNGWTV